MTERVSTGCIFCHLLILALSNTPFPTNRTAVCRSTVSRRKVARNFRRGLRNERTRRKVFPPPRTVLWWTSPPPHFRADACAPFGFGFRRIFPPKCFAFLRRISAKMGGEIIPGLLASIRKAASERRECVKGNPRKKSADD